MFPIPPAGACKIHMGIDALLGIDWWISKLLPRFVIRNRVARMLARHYQMTDVRPGVLSFTLPDEPNIIVMVMSRTPHKGAPIIGYPIDPAALVAVRRDVDPSESRS